MLQLHFVHKNFYSITMAHMVFVKNNYFLMRDFFFLENQILQLKVGCFKFFQSVIGHRCARTQSHTNATGNILASWLALGERERDPRFQIGGLTFLDYCFTCIWFYIFWKTFHFTSKHEKCTQLRKNNLLVKILGLQLWLEQNPANTGGTQDWGGIAQA